MTFLKELFDTLNVTDHFDKVALAAIVYRTYLDNRCGVTGDNREALRDVLIKDVCDPYEFEMLYLATSWTNDMVLLLCDHVGYQIPTAFFDYIIWPFMRRHEPLPGIRLTV